jgi:hypothetical protein
MRYAKYSFPRFLSKAYRPKICLVVQAVGALCQAARGTTWRADACQPLA